MKICNTCGAQIEDSATICQYCGTQINSLNNEAQEKPTDNNKTANIPAAENLNLGYNQNPYAQQNDINGQPAANMNSQYTPNMNNQFNQNGQFYNPQFNNMYMPGTTQSYLEYQAYAEKIKNIWICSIAGLVLNFLCSGILGIGFAIGSLIALSGAKKPIMPPCTPQEMALDADANKKISAAKIMSGITIGVTCFMILLLVVLTVIGVAAGGMM